MSRGDVGMLVAAGGVGLMFLIPTIISLSEGRRKKRRSSRPGFQTFDSAWAERQTITNSFRRTFFRPAKSRQMEGKFEVVGDFITEHFCGEGDDCRETCHAERLYRRTEKEELVCPNCTSHRRKS